MDLRVSDQIINMVDSFYSKTLDLVFSLEETSVDCLKSVVEFDNGLSVLNGLVVEVVEQKQVELGRYLVQNHDHEFSLSNVDRNLAEENNLFSELVEVDFVLRYVDSVDCVEDEFSVV